MCCSRFALPVPTYWLLAHSETAQPKPASQPKEREKFLAKIMIFEAKIKIPELIGNHSSDMCVAVWSQYEVPMTPGKLIARVLPLPSFPAAGACRSKYHYVSCKNEHSQLAAGA